LAATTNITVGGATALFGAANVGYIKDGVTITPTVELFTVDGIEQLLTPSKAWRITETFECSFTMVEPTQDNLEFALDLADGAFAAGTPNEVDFGTNVVAPRDHQTSKLTVTGYTCGATQYTRTIVFHNAVLMTPAPIKFTKSQETNLAVTYLCLYADDADAAVGTITDATS